MEKARVRVTFEVPQQSKAFDLLVLDSWSRRELAEKCVEEGALPVDAGVITLEREYREGKFVSVSTASTLRENDVVVIKWKADE